MGIIYNSLTPSEGLVLSLDTANRRSYPGAGNTWFDLSGNGNNGTLTNGASLNTGPGGGMNFDGVNDRITLPNNFQRNAQTGAISAWFRFAGNGANQNPIVSLGGNTNLTVFTFRRRDTADSNQNALSLRVFSNSIGPDIELFSTNKISNNIWAHGLIQSNGNNYELFINGLRQTLIFTSGSNTGDWIGDMVGTTGDTICDIGSQWASGSLFSSINGQIDDVKFYNRALSESEIRILFNSRRRRYGL